MQAPSEEAAEDEVAERIPPRPPHQQRVERYLRDHVGQVPDAGALSAYKARAEGVEEDLERREKGLAEHVAKTQHLEARGQVRVDAVLAEVLVVLDVIGLREEESAHGLKRRMRRAASLTLRGRRWSRQADLAPVERDVPA